MRPYNIERIRNHNDPCNSGWVPRHLDATRFPRGPEIPIVRLIGGWLDYANHHHRRFDSGIGEDGFLGQHWEAIGQALLAMLNGELGRLDGGTLDALIRDTLSAEGFDPNS